MSSARLNLHAYRSQFAMAPKSQPVLNMEQLRVRLGILHRRVEELETQVEAMPVMATATDVMLVAADLENFLTEKKREIATLKEEFIADTNDRIEALHKAEKAAKKAEKDLWKAQQIGKQQLHEAGQLLHKMQNLQFEMMSKKQTMSEQITPARADTKLDATIANMHHRLQALDVRDQKRAKSVDVAFHVLRKNDLFTPRGRSQSRARALSEEKPAALQLTRMQRVETWADALDD